MAVKLINSAQQRKEVPTPGSNPPPGTQFEYLKNDGELYKKNSTGQEFRVEGNGSKIFLSQTQI